MKITIVSVGRFKSGPERALFEHYKSRIGWPVSLREVEAKGRFAPAELVEREAELLASACPDGAHLIALDSEGKALSSEALAQHVRRQQEDGVRETVFLIGGADGLARRLTSRANLTLSLGPATWPHLLVRGMLMEQLYRAQQILAGHPYHRAGKPD